MKISTEVLNYLLDNNLIIGAEYDHPEEYSAEHWVAILNEGMELLLERGIK